MKWCELVELFLPKEGFEWWNNGRRETDLNCLPVIYEGDFGRENWIIDTSNGSSLNRTKKL